MVLRRHGNKEKNNAVICMLQHKTSDDDDDDDNTRTMLFADMLKLCVLNLFRRIAISTLSLSLRTSAKKKKWRKQAKNVRFIWNCLKRIFNINFAVLTKTTDCPKLDLLNFKHFKLNTNSFQLNILCRQWSSIIFRSYTW